MGIIVDLIIIGVVLLSVLLAYRKGLVKLGIGLIAFILAILITVILYKPVANLIINTTSIDETIENKIYSQVTQMINEDQKNEVTNQLIESAKSGMLPQAVRTLTIDIIYIGVMIIMFLLVRIGLALITAIADTIAKLPILKQFNKMGGIIYGILRGVVLIYIILLVIGIAGTVNPNNSLHMKINESYLGKTMYENNILNIFFKV